MIENFSDYIGCTITNIHRGKGDRSKYIYAQVVDINGRLLINATLQKCVELIYDRLPDSKV